MEGFEKINLDSNIESPKTASSTEEVPLQTRNLSSKKSFKKFFSNKKIQAICGMLLVLFVIFFFAVLLPLQRTYKSAKNTYAQVKLAVDALKKQNVDLAGEELQKTRQDLTQTQKDLHSMGYLHFVPIASWYYNDADHLIKAGFYGLDAANVLVESVKPYADVLGLKGQGSFVGGTAEQRVETAVKTMSKITPRIDDISKSVSLARTEIDYVDPNHYPAILGGQKIKNGLATVKELADSGATFIDDAKPLIKVLPALLGEPDEKKYLVIFQNDKELRPTGGFITAYSIFRLERGIVHVDRSSDIYDLDATIGSKPVAPQPILKYLANVPTFNLRDSNISPDFVVSMQTFKEMYAKAGGYTKVDGIIAVDTKALVEAMNILGDIQAGGTTFTTKIDPRCNCPKVIYDLEVYADQPRNTVVENRKGIIGELMYAIMNKAFSSSPKLYWGPLFQTMLTQVAQKHVLFYMYDKNAQAGLEALNASGRIMPFEGDYLHINEANFGGAKSNLFVSETVLQNYDVSSDGTVTKTVTVNYKNPFPPSDCNLERGQLCLNAVLRNWIRIYVPKGSQLISSKGSEVKVTSYDELGKTVFEGFMTVRPQGAAKVIFSYRLPFKLANGSPLPLLVQKQPGTNSFEYSITKGGREIEKFMLLTDKTLKLNLK